MQCVMVCNVISNLEFDDDFVYLFIYVFIRFIIYVYFLFSYTSEVLEIQSDAPTLHVLFVPGNPGVASIVCSRAYFSMLNLFSCGSWYFWLLQVLFYSTRTLWNFYMSCWRELLLSQVSNGSSFFLSSGYLFD